MREKHVVLKFDYEKVKDETSNAGNSGRRLQIKNKVNKKILFSKIVFPEVIRDVMFLELVNFSPSAVLFMFSCNILEGFFSNDEEEQMLSFSLGGVSTETRLKRRVTPSKSNVRELTLKMFHRDRAEISENRKDNAFAHLIIHHGKDHEEEMKETLFLLRLDSKDEVNKIHTVNFKLPRSIFKARAIKVLNCFSSGGFDFISCPFVESSGFETNDDDLKEPIVAFGVGGVSRTRDSFPIRESCSTLNVLTLNIQRLDGTAFRRNKSYVQFLIFHEE